MRCIFSADFIIVMRVGSINRLITRVRIRIDQPQFATMWSWVKRSATKSGFAIQPNQPKFRIGSRFGPVSVPLADIAFTLLSTEITFGPAKTLSDAGVLIDPTAAPSRGTDSVAPFGCFGSFGMLHALFSETTEACSGWSGRKIAPKYRSLIPA